MNLWNISRSIENLVFEGKYPQNGLPQIKSAVIRKLEWAQNLTKANIDRDIHNAFMSLMFASMYTFSVNGRLGGIADAKYGQRDELLTSGHAMTSLFKTSSSYGYQPIVVDYEVARRLLQIYIDCVRPTERFIQLQDRNSPLWTNYNGSALNSHAIGTLLKRFFIRECQLQLNSTALRGLMESYAQELFDLLTQARYKHEISPAKLCTWTCFSFAFLPDFSNILFIIVLTSPIRTKPVYD